MRWDGSDPQVQEILEDPRVKAKLEAGDCVLRVMTTKSLRYAYVSPNSKDLLGVDPESQLGKSCFEFISPEATTWVRELMDAAGQRPLISWYQTGGTGPDDRVWVRTESRPMGNFIAGCVRIEDDPSHHERRFEDLQD